MFNNQKRLRFPSIIILFSPIFFTGLCLFILDLQQASYISQTVVYDAALYYGLATDPLRRVTNTWACDGLWDCAETLCKFSLLPNVSWIAFRAFPRNDNETCQGIVDENIAYKLFTDTHYSAIRDVMLASFIVQLSLLFILFGLVIYPHRIMCYVYAFFLLSLTVLVIVSFISWMNYSSKLSYNRGDNPPPYVVSKILTLNILILTSVFILPVLVLFNLWVDYKTLVTDIDSERTPINHF